MAREIVSLERARLDLIEASLYLNKHQPGMGDELVAELDRLLERIAAFPEMCAEVDANTSSGHEALHENLASAGRADFDARRRTP